MKKALLWAVLLAALAALASCGDEGTPTKAREPESVRIADGGMPAGDTAGLSAGAQPETQPGEPAEESREFLELYGNSRAVVCEDRIVIVESDYADSVASLVKAGQFLIEKLPAEPKKYLMIVPSRITMEADELKEIAADQVKAIRDTYLDIDPEFSCIDVTYALSQHKGGVNDLFFRTDHHWTHLGAYLAAEAFFQAANVPYLTLDRYEKREGDPFLGYMYRVVGDTSLKDKPDDLVYYQLSGVRHTATAYTLNKETGATETKELTLTDPARLRRGYSLFMDSYGFDYAVIEGNPDGERALLVFGNSSVQALATWLADNYRTVVVVDTRYFSQGMKKIGELIAQYGVEDVLWVASMTSGTWFNLDEN